MSDSASLMPEILATRSAVRSYASRSPLQTRQSGPVDVGVLHQNPLGQTKPLASPNSPSGSNAADSTRPEETNRPSCASGDGSRQLPRGRENRVEQAAINVDEVRQPTSSGPGTPRTAPRDFAMRPGASDERSVSRRDMSENGRPRRSSLTSRASASRVHTGLIG